MRVGTKELKNRLSYYVRRVRAGDVVEITDRGTVVARIRGVAGEGGATLDRLEADGVVTRESRQRVRAFEPIRPKAGARVSAFVSEDRR
jgi:prevent-host-death family protein